MAALSLCALSRMLDLLVTNKKKLITTITCFVNNSAPLSIVLKNGRSVCGSLDLFLDVFVVWGVRRTIKRTIR